MKKVLLLVVTALFVCSATYSQTEDKTAKKEKKTSKFGSFVKKTVEASTGLNVSDEVYITMENKRQSDKIDLGFVGCYGDSKTGDVYMVITAKMKIDRIKVYINTENAATAKGKMYNTGNNYSTIDLEYAKNIPMEVNMAERPLLNVPESVKQLEDVKVRVQVGGDHDYYHFHNVPIQWDVKPE